MAGSGAGDEPLEIRILRSFRRIIRAVDLDSKKLVGQYGITGPQLRCLAALAHGGPVTPAALAREIHLSASTVVGILDRLEQKGWANRRRDASDRRLVWASATEEGRALVRAAPSPLQEMLSRGLGGLTALERTAIALALDRVVDLLEASEIEAAPLLETGPIEAGVPGAEAPRES